jgi:hypothetical protein
MLHPPLPEPLLCEDALLDPVPLLPVVLLLEPVPLLEAEALVDEDALPLRAELELLLVEPLPELALMCDEPAPSGVRWASPPDASCRGLLVSDPASSDPSDRLLRFAHAAMAIASAARVARCLPISSERIASASWPSTGPGYRVATLTLSPRTLVMVCDTHAARLTILEREDDAPAMPGGERARGPSTRAPRQVVRFAGFFFWAFFSILARQSARKSLRG